MPVVAETHRSVARTASDRGLRILHVISFLGQGGTEHVVLQLIASFRDQRFEQSICTTRGYNPDFARSQGVEGKLYSAGTQNLKFQFPLFRLAQIMRRVRPDIVHTRNWGGLDAVPAARLAGVPVVIHSEHGYEMEDFSGVPLRRRLFRRAAYAMADVVFTVSNELREFHARQAWFPCERIQVIHNGVDAKRFAPCRATRERMRAQLGCHGNMFVIGTVGRVTSIKSQETLLKAAEHLMASRADVRVVLAGTGPLLDQIRSQVAGSALLAERVRLLGASEDIPELLNAMDVFVLPSLQEGLSNTVLEAMASGLPVIVTRVGGNAEIVEQGASGWLFEPKDDAGLAHLLERLYTDAATRQSLGRAARERIVAQFELGHMLENYRRLYVEAAGRRMIWRNEA